MTHCVSLSLISLLLATFRTPTALSQETWMQFIGGKAKSYRCADIEVAADGGVALTGTTSPSEYNTQPCALIVKLGKDGTMEWTRNLGCPEAYGRSLATLPDGGMVVTGAFGGYGDVVQDFSSFHIGLSDIYVVKLDKEGELVWMKSYGGTGLEEGMSISHTADDGFVITGQTTSNDGVFKGLTKNYGGFMGDCFVIKLNKNGNLVWKKAFGGEQDDGGNSICATSDSGCVITGYYYHGEDLVGSEDVFVMKLSNSGDVVWETMIGGEERDIGTDVRISPDGEIFVTGYTNSNDSDFAEMGKGGQDVFLAKLSKDGALLWTTTFGGTMNESAYSISPTIDGGALVIGETESNDIDFKRMNKGGYSAFVLKVDHSGQLIWKEIIGGAGFDSGSAIETAPDGTFVVAVDTYSKDSTFKGVTKGTRRIFVSKQLVKPRKSSQ